MKKLVKVEEIDAFDLVSNKLKSYGWQILEKPHKNSNGPDLVAVNGKNAYRFEIKKAIKKQSGSWQCDPISESRKRDDFVAMIIGNEIVFDSMNTYIEKCSDSGYRVVSDFAELFGL